MPILNYTTQIDAHRTVGEIQAMLAKAGAKAVSVEYGDGVPAAVMFAIDIAGFPTRFRLPSRWEGVAKRLEADRDVPRRLRTEEQARRVAWRIVKDWVEAQLAIIDAGVAELAEVFLPYAVNPQTGRTLYQQFEAGSGFLLTKGKNDD